MSKNNNRKNEKLKKMLFFFSRNGLSFERTAQAEPDSLVRISLQTEASQPKVNSEERKCVKNICSRAQIQAEPVAFT